MSELRIDLFSDTKTRPSPAMRQAMAEAQVGDEQADEDPSVTRLCELTAEMLGKDAALFLPSGTMCNEIAYAVHCRAGDEIIAERSAHTFNFEGGGPAVISRAMLRPIDGKRGLFTAAQLEEAIRPRSQYAPRSQLVSIEQTANMAGGTVWPQALLAEVTAVARRHGLIGHMDGARLFNAVIASGVPAHEHAKHVDSLWIDLTKGLGAPVGAVLVGDTEFIAEARQWKQMLGGAMRQAGVIAAAGIYALEHNIERLAEDHANAKTFAEAIADIPGIAVHPEDVETNLVFFDVARSGQSIEEIGAKLRVEGIRVSPAGATRLRAVTHMDVTRDDVLEAAAALDRILRGG